jgi:hypothetical protein
MKYLLTIHTDENADKNASPEEQQKVFAAYMAYTEAMKKAGVWLGGEALQPTETGTRVRVEADKPRVVDGPFTETKEVLGGYYLMEVKSKEEAVEWAKRCPASSHGTVEVRPIWEFG